MNLEQRFDFHRELADVMHSDKISNSHRKLLGELRNAIYDMCRCWPCGTHENIPAVYLGCEFCKVCSQHAHSLAVYAGKR